MRKCKITLRTYAMFIAGQIQIFPLRICGNWHSKEHYKNDYELMEIFKKYCKQDVPFVQIIQNWQYCSNNYLWNDMEFINPHFYNQKKMAYDVQYLNTKMVFSNRNDAKKMSTISQQKKGLLWNAR